ncbi:cell death-inducing p53-target protein 1-like isoform X2 [Chrysoperla carnea]|uniref:cell death-inducing p53-target protein 1-like isoform X2 n=1 Tax=Chrysoperla carnea TaxID=189513 RepID=UPI001D08608B|nr:cell death-inducing p53-target protein 1-like isoform X2 [Chrysoperla carnea]
MSRQPYPTGSGGYQQQQGASPSLLIDFKVPPLDSKLSYETQESIKPLENIQDLSHQSTVQWCPTCGRTVKTTVKYKASIFTFCWFLVLCLTLVLCWIPSVINKCKNANHYCPECGAMIGTHDGSCC